MGSLASAFVRFVVGPNLTAAQKANMLTESGKSLAAQMDLLKLKIERLNTAKLTLAKMSDLQEGSGVLFTDYVLQPAVLFKTGERSCVARSAVCTHLGCTVQTDLVDGKIFCPCHQSYFKLEDGAPVAGPATIPLAEEPIVIEGDTVYLVKPTSPIKIGPNQTPLSPA